ncbi:MAG TPA: tetratricopeptide repeat protein [Verrucomicrobiae bacterium]|nr:tetratricopeptide repeat protein [Verrucomicrobiae bacterium]
MHSRHRHSLLCSFICALQLGAAVHAAEPLIWTNRVAAVSNEAIAALLQQDRQAIEQALEQLRAEVSASRAEVSASSKDVMERTARESDALSTKVNETLKERLELIERSLAQRQERELAALRDSNRTFLTVAGLFAGLGFLGIIIAAAILARAINRFSELAMNLPAGYALGRGADHAALGAGDLHGIGPVQFEQASVRFAEAMARLEKRIKELEHSHHTLDGGGETHPEGAAKILSSAPAAGEERGAAHPKLAHSASTVSHSSADTEHRSEVSVLLGKGQSLVNLGQIEEAIECFNKAIALDPKNSDVFVKKGLAMERMQKMEEAIESYDRAIALNDSFTLAYLYKGAVCNKLQRFREALECYEKALRTEQKSVAA